MDVHTPITSADDPRFQFAMDGIIQLAMHRPYGGYRVIYIDYPWLFMTRSLKGAGKSPLRHYPCISTELGKQLPVGDLAGENCALFMWAIWPMIFDVQDLLKAWGFEYSGLGWEWRKVNPKTGKAPIGGGYGTRKNLEPCLLARRGSPHLKTKSERDYLEAPRREHSRKPEEAYDKIERMFDGPYVEVFARSARPGWSHFGDEVGKFEERAA